MSESLISNDEFIHQRMENNSSPAGLPRSVQANMPDDSCAIRLPREFYLSQTATGINQI